MNEERKGSLELNWVNKDKSLLYEYDEDGDPVRPKKWVDKDDLRVAEPRPLKYIDDFGSKPIDEFDKNITSNNLLIKGDNLLALRSLVEMFKDKTNEEKVKCIYIDPPFNTGRAFENYDDNLEHSEWLSMMKDRLTLLKRLLRKDGLIFVHIDKNEYHYLKVLMDEIFGRDNFVNSITIKDSHPSGLKIQYKNKTIVKIKSEILVYSGDGNINLTPQYKTRSGWDTHYNGFLDITKTPPKLYNLKEVLIEEGILEKGETYSDLNWDDKEFRNFCMKNKDKIVQSTEELPEHVEERSIDNEDSVIVGENDKGKKIYAYNGRRLAPLQESLNPVGIEGAYEEDWSYLLCDIWDDIDFNNTQNEGVGSFPAAKKPEFLIARILSMATNEGDLVLDSFAGSGTTAAVAQKMNRKWIAIELGDHADTHCYKRLKKIIKGEDDTGISNQIEYKRGGYFSYYQVGNSMLDLEGEINWSHSTEELAKSVFWMFDYSFEEPLEFQSEFDLYLGQKKEKFAFSIISEDARIIRKEELDNILDLFQEEYGPNKEIEIYTNYGVGVDEKDLPNNLTIRKVPDCILEKYKLGEE